MVNRKNIEIIICYHINSVRVLLLIITDCIHIFTLFVCPLSPCVPKLKD